MQTHLALSRASARQTARPSGASPAAGARPEVRQILHAPQPQAKLTVGAPNDAFEREADQVADQVMRMPEAGVAAASAASAASTPSAPPRVQRRCAHCEEEHEKGLQAKEEPGRTPEVPGGFEQRFAALRGGGRPLPAAERAFFEPRFGRDFGAVRLHAGAAASGLAGSVHARAFTLGDSIVFGSGQYSPGTTGGRQLLAHELTHVVQQGGAAPAPRVQRLCADCEQEERGKGVLRRQPDPAEPAMTRREEIELSRSSPGQLTGEIDPLTLSLYNYAID